MKIKILAAVYSITVGIAMMGMWFIFYVSNQIPELQDEPARIIMHIAAEYVTAILLVTGGFALLTNRRWGMHMMGDAYICFVNGDAALYAYRKLWILRTAGKSWFCGDVCSFDSFGYSFVDWSSKRRGKKLLN